MTIENPRKFESQNIVFYHSKRLLMLTQRESVTTLLKQGTPWRMCLCVDSRSQAKCLQSNGEQHPDDQQRQHNQPETPQRCPS